MLKIRLHDSTFSSFNLFMFIEEDGTNINNNEATKKFKSEKNAKIYSVL